MRLILHAPNVHQGGGLVLLRELISFLPDTSQLILDARYPSPPGNLNAHFIKPSLWHRFKAEWLLKSIAKRADVVLCLGNLPPLFTLNADVNLFLHNRYIVDRGIPLTGFKFRVRVRIFLERIWLLVRSNNIKNLVVQSNSMREIAVKALRRDVNVLSYIPQIKNPAQYEDFGSNNEGIIEKEGFIYVASGEPHKNHRNLVLAWVELARWGIFPSLYLTLNKDTHPSLCDWIERTASTYDLRIKNKGSMSHAEVLSLYGHVNALIFPSVLESFGLPLIEADRLGLPIIASELDYVRDVVSPRETFDPTSSRSIARSVKRFLGNPEPFVPLLSAEKFFNEFIKST